MKWNESGFRPPLCTYRLYWARRTSWGWWDDWDDTVLQTQNSKFEPWRSEAEHATSRSGRLPKILTCDTWMGKKHFCFFQTAATGNRAPNSGLQDSGANHYPRAPAHELLYIIFLYFILGNASAIPGSNERKILSSKICSDYLTDSSQIYSLMSFLSILLKTPTLTCLHSN